MKFRCQEYTRLSVNLLQLFENDWRCLSSVYDVCGWIEPITCSKKSTLDLIEFVQTVQLLQQDQTLDFCCVCWSVCVVVVVVLV